MGKVKLTVRVEYEGQIDPDTRQWVEDKSIIYGAILDPVGVRVGPLFSGSGFRNSAGDNTIRRGEYAVKMAEEIAEAVNAAGGVSVDPYEEEYDRWDCTPYWRQ